MTAVVFLVQVLGFCFTAGPITSLCFVPFEDSALKRPRKVLKRIAAFHLVVLGLGFGLVCVFFYDPALDDNPPMRLATNLYLVFAIAVGCTVYARCVSAPPFRRLIVAIFLIHCGTVLYGCATLEVFGEWLFLPGALPFQLKEMVTMPPALVATYLLARYGMFPLLRTGFLNVNDATLRRGVGALLLSYVFYAGATIITAAEKYNGGINTLNQLIPLLALIGADICLYFMYFSEMQLDAENQELEGQLRAFDAQYEEISQAVENARRFRHDIRHHLGTISMLNQTGKYKELTQYLDQYIGSYQATEDVKSSGSPAVDNILQYYLERAREQGIEVELDMNLQGRDYGFDIVDLTVLFGNLLENAIEACLGVPKDKTRKIELHLGDLGNSLLIQEENSCMSGGDMRATYSDGSTFLSNKKGNRLGHGMTSMISIAEKYNGTAEFRKWNGIFSARLILNGPGRKEEAQ